LCVVPPTIVKNVVWTGLITRDVAGAEAENDIYKPLQETKECCYPSLILIRDVTSRVDTDGQVAIASVQLE
jgi:hypothetical protein